MVYNLPLAFGTIERLVAAEPWPVLFQKMS